MIPNEGIVLVRRSLVLGNPSEVTEAHREGEEFYVDEKKAGEYLEKAKSSRAKSAFLLTDLSAIPTDRFGEDGRTVWLFGGEGNARVYGEFLNDAGVNEMPLDFDGQDYIDSEDKPFANQLWLGGLRGGSRLDGIYRSLGCGNRVRGVFPEYEARASKVSGPKKSELYTPTQVRKALESIKMQGLESQLMEALRE